MGFFDFFIRHNINDGVEEFKKTPRAVLLDVRTGEEYLEGHIEQSVNIPLQLIDCVTSKIKDKTIPVFVYCQSGARSGTAAARLKELGYVNVKNIGGISAYRGDII